MIEYTSVDRILSSVHRELGELPFEEDDILEWIGEAIGFLNVYPILEDRVTTIQVKDFRGQIPSNLVHLLSLHKKGSIAYSVESEKPKLVEVIDCFGTYSIKYEFEKWNQIVRENEGLVPIVKGDHSKISRNKCDKDGQTSEGAEYTIVGGSHREFLFSFRDGPVIIAYKAVATDEETGYPLIPDQSDFLSAVLYYLKWKISEAMTWRGREGYSQMLQYARGEWLRYAKQAKNWAKMPKTAEEWQSVMMNQYYSLTDLQQFYKGFSRLRLRNNGI